jgi:hypothetical protein
MLHTYLELGAVHLRPQYQGTHSDPETTKKLFQNELLNSSDVLVVQSFL